MSPRENVLKLSVLCSVIAAVVCAASARAATIAYDDFAYPAGSSLAGQNGGQGFSGAWYQGGFNVGQSAGTVASGPLTHPPLVTTGNEVTIPTSSALNGIERDLASSFSSGTMYVSCLLRPEGTLGQGNGNGFFGVYLHGSLNEVFFGDSGAYGTGGRYAVEQRGGFASAPSPDLPVLGQTEFLVLRAQLTSAGDIFTLYADPAPGAAEPSTGAVQNLNVGSLSSLVIYSGGAFDIGELRVGTTYADVTPIPEPSALVLLAIGAASCLAYAWHWRTKAA
jgi:hypothetical protein